MSLGGFLSPSEFSPRRAARVFPQQKVNTTTQIQCPRQTPWGYAQTTQEIAKGIWRVTTAGHGGYWLAETTLRQLHPAWRGFVGFSGSYQWFEEDCDWAVIALCFPDHFNDYFIYSAFKTLATVEYAKERLQEFLKSTEGRTMLKLMVLWEEDHKHLFQMGSMYSYGRGWDCSAYRIDGRERLVWHQGDYPIYEHPFDKAELAAFTVRSEEFPARASSLANLMPQSELEAA